MNAVKYIETHGLIDPIIDYTASEITVLGWVYDPATEQALAEIETIPATMSAAREWLGY